MNVRELRAHAEELGFTPQEAVRWLAPRELARTAVKVALAGVFAGYADKREIQGALGEELLQAPTGDPTSNELWFDYVADLGDGFDATASVAWMLGTEKLTVDTPGPFQGRLTRGSLLVLGGDEVYPVASTTAYEDRMKGPYRSALPHADDQPLMLALPGNHDWYDGLTAFLRVFAQQRSIGGWRTRQTRSYFAVGLPQRWWLVGLDSQLGSYFDDPQLRYFEKHLSSNLQPGDGVIVCCAAPTWVKSADGDVDAFNALHWFDRNIVRTRVVDHETGERAATGASIRLWLTGDKHHYARFAERLPGDPGGETSGDPTTDVDLPPDPRRRQLVTCGMGGAYLASTHRLPASLPLPPAGARMRDKDDPPLDFARAQHTYPTAEESRRLARRITLPWSPNWLPRRNPGFPTAAGLVHVALFLVVSAAFGLAEGRRSPVAAIRTADAADLGSFAAVLLGLAVLLFACGRVLRLVRRREPAAPSGFTTAVLAQLMAALAVLACVVAVPFPAGMPGWQVLLAALLVAGVGGALLGSQAFAVWVLSARRGPAVEWQMSGQSVDDHKAFVRLHIGPDGELTLYPLALDRVCRDWELERQDGGGVRPVPAQPLSVRLIEEPVVIDREARQP
jgi:hypothetical protein